MTNDGIKLSWIRPASVEYPKIWHTFKARDVDSDDLVEYRIQDLPQSRAEDAYKHMYDGYVQDQPIIQQFTDLEDKLVYYNDFKMGWQAMVDQKLPLVCFKDGSDDIVGMHFIFVCSRKDKFDEVFMSISRSRITKMVFSIANLLYESFNVYDHYNVEEYLASHGLSVDKKYRGRAIGDEFLKTRKLVCQEFGIKVTHSMFSSDYSNRNAERCGFVTNAEIRYEDVVKTHPEFDVSKVKSTAMAIKSQVY